MLSGGFLLTQGSSRLWFLTPLHFNALNNFLWIMFRKSCSFRDDSFKKTKTKNSLQARVFPKQDERLSGSRTCDHLSALWVCHCLSGQMEKQSISNARFFNVLKVSWLVCAGLLIYFMTGSCRGRALSAGRRAAWGIPVEWVHAGLVCAEIP